MSHFNCEYDVIVVGAGHAGCEAAHASSKMGSKTLLLTMNLDSVAKMSCNPAIGGTGKGHLVKEVDALGGIMGRICDSSAIQYRCLNASKGPSVWSLRAQCDRALYSLHMKWALEELDNLDLFQATTTDLIVEDGSVAGVKTQEGIEFRAKAVVIATGTFLQGKIHIGQDTFNAGRAGDRPSIGLSRSLKEHGFNLSTLKTGTPPRVYKNSIDFTKLEEQPSQENLQFSHEKTENPLNRVSCHLTYTNSKTKAIVASNKNLSAIFSGAIDAKGPRYCPSIEDKVDRFSDKERHQIFIEPEGLYTQECYLNGISTSLPFSVQMEMIRSIEGFENVRISRPAYAIEYEYATDFPLDLTLQTKKIEGLYFAGQLNGTTGYEEAAAQGLIAGVNASLKVRGDKPFILKRSEAYIGVLIDDIVTKPITEPYRIFTNRAEYRLILRQDNADLRLSSKGYDLGLIKQDRFDAVCNKQKNIDETIALLQSTYVKGSDKKLSLATLLKQPEYNYHILVQKYQAPLIDEQVQEQVEIHLKYEGYINKQLGDIKKLHALEEFVIPSQFSYRSQNNLKEALVDRLQKTRPHTLAQAARIEGISPSDISVLMIALQKYKRLNHC